jgi:excisionase family DNA binding protein
MSHDKTPWYAAGETGRPRPLLTIDALSALLAVDRKTVYRLPIPYVVVGSRRRFRPEDVERYLERGDSP